MESLFLPLCCSVYVEGRVQGGGGGNQAEHHWSELLFYSRIPGLEKLGKGSKWGKRVKCL